LIGIVVLTQLNLQAKEHLLYGKYVQDKCLSSVLSMQQKLKGWRKRQIKFL